MAALLKYDDISLSVAENGFILSYTEIRKKPGKTDVSRYDNCIRDYKREVFEFSSGDKAIQRMAELAKSANKNIAKAMETVKASES